MMIDRVRCLSLSSAAWLVATAVTPLCLAQTASTTSTTSTASCAAPTEPPACDARPTVLPRPERECPITGGRAVAIRVARVGVEVLLGTAIGAAGEVLGAYAGLNVDLVSGNEAGAGLALGASLGALIAVAPGVWLGGQAMGGDGSFGWTLLGSAAGTGLSAGLLAIDATTPSLVIAALLPVVGATTGYELSSHTRRAQRSERTASSRAAFVPTLVPGGVGVVGIF